tara:strand:- start:218 stop:970 length:753 start_codon:yes stop_codon:yes gene_type:complete
MIKNILLLSFLLSISLNANAGVTEYRLASWNILCATCNPSPIVPSWNDRKAEVVSKIIDGGASIVALQEVQSGEQLDYILAIENYSACVSEIDYSLAHTVILIKTGIDYDCLQPIDIADKRQCVHVLVSGVNYYNCHFPLTDELNTESMDIFLSSVQLPLVFMGDYNTWSGETGYPQNDAKLLQYVQTREDVNGADAFWNIDKIGTSDQTVIVRFDREHDMSLSDHPYVKAKFINLNAIIVTNNLILGLL